MLIESSILSLMILLTVNKHIKYVHNILHRLQGNLIQCMGVGEGIYHLFGYYPTNRFFIWKLYFYSLLGTREIQ